MDHKNYKKILIISSNFYQEISDNLIEGATNYLKLKKIRYEILTVPGSMEIPLFLKKNIDKFLGFIILGCVIKILPYQKYTIFLMKIIFRYRMHF